MSDLEYKPVIGLEVHIQLKTKSKMFGSAPNQLDMEQPNVNIDEVVTAQPVEMPAAAFVLTSSFCPAVMAIECVVSDPDVAPASS